MEKIPRASLFINLIVLVASLLAIVFCKMENRRLGYIVWKLARKEKAAQDTVRLESLRFAELTRPERIESFATRFFELKKANSKQIIQMDGRFASIQ